MSFIVMSDGTEVDMLYPCPTSVSMDHIPHQLATINRFTGAACRPYSVAEHSLLVCEIAQRVFGLNVHGLMAALLHDVHEVYTSDLHSPGKQAVGIGWRAFEGRFERLVHVSLHIVTPSMVFREQIKRADLIALATEREQLLPGLCHGLPSSPWPCLHGIEPVTWVDLMDDTRQRMTWQDWRQAFTDRYDELKFERGLGIDKAETAA